MPSDRRSPAHGNAGRRSGSGQRGAGLERRELSGVWRRVLTLLSSGGVGSLPSPSGRFLMLKSKLGTPGSHLGTPGMAPDQTFSLITSRSIIPVSKWSFPRLKWFQLCCWLGESPPDPSAVPSAGPPANTLVPGAGWGHGASPTAAALQSRLPVAELAAHLKCKATLRQSLEHR